MKKITLLAALLLATVSFSQIASTSFEEPATFSGKYTDLGDPSVAHALDNNANEPLVNYLSTGGELGFSAKYVPFDTPDVGLTDGDFVGVTKTKPSSSVPYPDGAKGYRMSDVDGNMILEFDHVDLSGINNPTVAVDFLLGINSNPTKGNYEGDGSINASGHDRLRIFVKDITNANDIDLFDSTGTNLDEFVPTDPVSGDYLLQWQTASANLVPESLVQLVIEGRNNASAESFWFDNVVFHGAMGIQDQGNDPFSLYPNPANNGFVNIASPNIGMKKISVFDVLGNVVISANINGERLDISNLPSGIYFVKVEQGKNSATKKLIVN